MWVLTSAGDMVNISTARRLYYETVYDGVAMKVIAEFAPQDCVMLALIQRVPGTLSNEMKDRTHAAYRSLISGLREGVAFCELSQV